MGHKEKGNATEESLGELHGELARYFTNGILHGMEAVNEDGKIIRTAATPAYLNVVRQFLKDNGIQAVARKGKPLGDLAAALPSFEELED